MDLDVLLYKWVLMILGGILTVGTLIATIFTLVFGPGIGWAALMLFCSLIGAVTFYSGWEIVEDVRKSKNLKTKKPLMRSIIRNHNQHLILARDMVM